MTLAEKRKHLQISILRFLQDSQARFGQPEGVIYQWARSEGRPNLQRKHLAEALNYLRSKGLIEVVGDKLSPEIRGWQITGDGTDYIHEQQPDED